MQKVPSSRLPPVWPSDVVRDGQKMCQSLAKVLKVWKPRSYHWLVHPRTHANTCRPGVLLIAGRSNDIVPDSGSLVMYGYAAPASARRYVLSHYLPVWSCRLLSFQSLPSAPPTVPACTVSSPTSQSAMCSGTAGTAKPVAISAPLGWRMTARRASACGQTRCQNARLKVGIATIKCYRSLGWRGRHYWCINFSGTAVPLVEWLPTFRNLVVLSTDCQLTTICPACLF